MDYEIVNYNICTIFYDMLTFLEVIKYFNFFLHDYFANNIKNFNIFYSQYTKIFGINKTDC